MADEKMDKKGLVYLNDVVISANVYVLTLVNLLLTCNLIVYIQNALMMYLLKSSNFHSLAISYRGCVSTGATGVMAPVNFEKAYLALVKF